MISNCDSNGRRYPDPTASDMPTALNTGLSDGVSVACPALMVDSKKVCLNSAGLGLNAHKGIEIAVILDLRGYGFSSFAKVLCSLRWPNLFILQPRPALFAIVWLLLLITAMIM